MHHVENDNLLVLHQDDNVDEGGLGGELNFRRAVEPTV
jgi:hypothetical protein